MQSSGVLVVVQWVKNLTAVTWVAVHFSSVESFHLSFPFFFFFVINAVPILEMGIALN